MGDRDPVSWETRAQALGDPAAEVEEYVGRLAVDVRGEDPYAAVKAVHDALSEDLADEERSVPGLGEVFITAYLLEKRGVIDPEEGGEYPSLVARRPSTDRLRELFWDRERTLWWIGIVTGVHPSLVTYWLYEDDIPLMERNYTGEAMERIRAQQEKEPE
ncbi:MAG: hypothetical protein V5A13_04160 [Haloarculaceae archaeon]